MKLSITIVGAVALGLAAACTMQQRPLGDAQRAAIGDSVDQVATGMMTTVAAQPSADRFLANYVPGNAEVHAEYGMIYPTFDSLAKVVRAGFGQMKSFNLKLTDRRITVLDRDVVVLTGMIVGTVTDTANKVAPFREAWTAVFHRTADGWKIAADHESTAPPAPAPAPARKR
jgi:ketosteroid isomerase-like protein